MRQNTPSATFALVVRGGYEAQAWDIALIALASLVSFCAGSFVTLDVLSRAASRKVEARKAYWTSVLNSEVTIGESKDEVEAWIVRRTHISDENYEPGAKKFFVITDTIDDPVGFPCDSWTVAIEVKIGADGRVVSRDVSISGACV